MHQNLFKNLRLGDVSSPDTGLRGRNGKPYIEAAMPTLDTSRSTESMADNQIVEKDGTYLHPTSLSQEAFTSSFVDYNAR